MNQDLYHSVKSVSILLTFPCLLHSLAIKPKPNHTKCETNWQEIESRPSKEVGKVMTRSGKLVELENRGNSKEYKGSRSH